MFMYYMNNEWGKLSNECHIVWLLELSEWEGYRLIILFTEIVSQQS